MLKKIRKDESGSALVWALVVVVIFVILVWGITWVALAMNNRSINNNSKQQAYFTARSAVDAIYNQLGTESDLGEYINDNLLAKTATKESPAKMKIEDMGFDETMGKCSVELSYNGTSVTITASSEKAGQGDTVVLEVQKNNSAEGSWPSKNNGTELVGKDEKIISPIGDESGKPIVYVVNKDNDDDNNGGKLIVKDGSGPIFIYINEGCELEIKSFQFQGEKDKEPDIFIFLEKGENHDGAELELKGTGDGNKPYPFFIYGEKGSKEDKPEIKIDDHGNQNVQVYNYGGDVKIDVDDDDNHKKGTLENLNKKPTSGYPFPPSENGGGNSSTKWTKLKYSTDFES